MGSLDGGGKRHNTLRRHSTLNRLVVEFAGDIVHDFMVIENGVGGGFVLEGTVGELTRYEVGYSVYKQDKELISPDDKNIAAFPKQFKLPLEGKIDKGTFCFLIGRSEKPVGLIGARTRQTGREPTLWPLADGVDALLIPPR